MIPYLSNTQYMYQKNQLKRKILVNFVLYLLEKRLHAKCSLMYTFWTCYSDNLEVKLELLFAFKSHLSHICLIDSISLCFVCSVFQGWEVVHIQRFCKSYMLQIIFYYLGLIYHTVITFTFIHWYLLHILISTVIVAMFF